MEALAHHWEMMNELRHQIDAAVTSPARIYQEGPVHLGGLQRMGSVWFLALVPGGPSKNHGFHLDTANRRWSFECWIHGKGHIEVAGSKPPSAVMVYAALKEMGFPGLEEVSLEHVAAAEANGNCTYCGLSAVHS